MPASDVALCAACNASRPASDQIAAFGPITGLRTAFSSLLCVAGIVHTD